MAETSGEPIDIWKRLKRLAKDRDKICARIKRLNASISHRSKKLEEIGERHSKLTFAIDRLRDQLSVEQVALIIKLLNLHSQSIDKLTEDIAELSDPNIALFVELQDVDDELNALRAIIEVDTGEQHKR
ncbi:MAG: hypothetical protein K8F91_10360 [Candidatus Obscuribacterales bacterium]|nr:hypothetical protein [Candidatus Obscuribacterales bacterium]